MGKRPIMHVWCCVSQSVLFRCNMYFVSVKTQFIVDQDKLWVFDTLLKNLECFHYNHRYICRLELILESMSTGKPIFKGMDWCNHEKLLYVHLNYPLITKGGYVIGFYPFDNASKILIIINKKIIVHLLIIISWSLKRNYWKG